MNECLLEGDDWATYKYRPDIFALLEGDDWSLSVFRACSWCGNRFIGVRRQEYCTMRCSQAARDERRKSGEVYISAKQKRTQGGIVTATCHYCGNTQTVIKPDMQPALCCQCKRPMEITSIEEDK